MTCVHLQKLYELCADSKIKLSGSDLVQIVCEECGVQEACPSMLMDEYDYKEASRDSRSENVDKENAKTSNNENERPVV